MTHHQLLLERLDEIARSLEHTGGALALIGLGSVGVERERLDDFSDLDFFVIVAPAHKRRFIDNLEWIESIHPVAYRFLNTEDGYKLLFSDGVFCEFAVFELDELAGIPFAPGLVVWSVSGIDASIGVPVRPIQPPSVRSVEWLIGEALTNLYVGMCRFRRGEKLSAERFVQHHSVDRVIELIVRAEPEPSGLRDPFNIERRFEARYPGAAQLLASFVQGYDSTPQSALAILSFLEGRFDVNAPMAESVRRLCESHPD
jgi:hypothetical protein